MKSSTVPLKWNLFLTKPDLFYSDSFEGSDKRSSNIQCQIKPVHKDK